jgi:hypothetical protein
VAAVSAKAGLIVTNNLRHFPARALTPFGIEAWEPDRFLLHLLELSPNPTVAALRRFSHALKSPPIGPTELLDHLSRHVPRFSEAARRLL